MSSRPLPLPTGSWPYGAISCCMRRSPRLAGLAYWSSARASLWWATHTPVQRSTINAFGGRASISHCDCRNIGRAMHVACDEDHWRSKGLPPDGFVSRDGPGGAGRLDVDRFRADDRRFPGIAGSAFDGNCKLRRAGYSYQLGRRRFGRKNLSWRARLPTTLGWRGPRLLRCDARNPRPKLVRLPHRVSSLFAGP